MVQNLFADEAIDLAPEEVARRLDAGAVQVVDVREPHEWQAGRIPGARHLEIERVAWNAETIDATRPVIFHCRLGLRGGLVAHAFRSIGYEAYNMRGGFQAWFDAGLPTEPEGAVVADH